MVFRRIKQLRLEHGLTQCDVAKLLGVHPSTYARYETGRLTITCRHIVCLAIYYQVSADYLVNRTDDRKPYESSLRAKTPHRK